MIEFEGGNTRVLYSSIRSKLTVLWYQIVSSNRTTTKTILFQGEEKRPTQIQCQNFFVDLLMKINYFLPFN